MNKNKGIIGIGLIVAIVLGIIVVGSGAYYLGKSGNKQEVKSPENILLNNGNQELPVVDNKKDIKETTTTTECVSNSPSSIKVLSPNGGETYTAGQKITVKWKSCNFPSNANGINISVVWKGDMEALTATEINGTPNDGQELITLPRQEKIKDFYTNTFVVHAQMNIPGQNLTVDGDDSDNSFTINSITKTDIQLTENNNGKIVNANKGQIIVATLCNLGDGGYQFDTPKYDSSVLTLLSHTNVPIEKRDPLTTGGCYGNDVFKFQTLKTGTSKIVITGSQPWDGGDKLLSILSTTIIVK